MTCHGCHEEFECSMDRPDPTKFCDACAQRLVEDVMPKLTEALRLLHDYQNGCPLPSYEKYWTRAMKLAEDILPEAEKAMAEEVKS